jgi:hypothetical protein
MSLVVEMMQSKSVVVVVVLVVCVGEKWEGVNLIFICGPDDLPTLLATITMSHDCNLAIPGSVSFIVSQIHCENQEVKQQPVNKKLGAREALCC